MNRRFKIPINFLIGKIFTAKKQNLLIMPVVDALAERTEEGRLNEADNDGLLSYKLYPSVSEWRNPQCDEH